MSKGTDPTQPTAYAVEMIRVQGLSQYCRDAEPGIACVEASCTCQDKARAALVLRPDIDPAERAWHQGAIARRSEIKRDANPYPVRGSREWNAWAGSWAAEDHNIRTIDMPEIKCDKVSTITPEDLTAAEYQEFVRLYSIEQLTEEDALRRVLSRRSFPSKKNVTDNE